MPNKPSIRRCCLVMHGRDVSSSSEPEGRIHAYKRVTRVGVSDSQKLDHVDPD